VTHMHRVLREALQQALRWQLLARNPADAVRPPKVERKQMNVLDTDATAALIEAARPYRIFVPILLGVLCGLRRGEIAALRWKSVDLEAGQLRVVASIEQTKAGCREKETKSGRDRVVALPAMLIAELRRHRAEQAQELLQLGVRLADDSYVVAQADGSPLQPNSLTHAFTDFLEAHGGQEQFVTRLFVSAIERQEALKFEVEKLPEDDHDALLRSNGTKIDLQLMEIVIRPKRGSPYRSSPRVYNAGRFADYVIDAVQGKLYAKTAHPIWLLLYSTHWACDPMHRSKKHRYSITSSARASSIGGTSRPSALAVLRLMTSSNFVGACTGKSAGFAPFRILST
jgi:integrase-like protein